MDQQKFKQKEIGMIPKDWGVVTLRDVVDNDDDIVAGPFGSNLKVSDYKENGIPIIRLQNIERNNFVYKDIKYVSQKKAEELKYHSFRAGDIVLAKLGDPIGKTSIVPSSLERGIVVADVVRIRISTRRVSSFFVEYILNSPISTVQLQKETIGTTRPRVNIFQIRNLKIPLPPLPEQKKIAEILSTVDQGIEKVDEAIKKTQRLKNGLMQTLLTKGIQKGKFKIQDFKDTEIGRIPKEWEIAQLMEVADINKESVDPERKFPDTKFLYVDIDTVENGTGIITGAKEIIGENAPSRARRVIHFNDVLMSTVRPYLKAFAIVPEKFHNQICSTGFAVLTCKERISPLYLLYSLFSSSVIEQCNKIMVSGQYPALNTSQVEKIKIPIPSLAEQQKIAEILSTVDKRIESLRNRKKKLERVKKGLMEDLLTGRKRVKL
jgi:type I restriction enzyme S subunit